MGKTNKVILIGVLGSDILIKNFENGGCVGNTTIATSYSYKSKSGEKITNTEWHRLVFSNKAAEIVSKYCSKGSRLYIEGRLRYREYEKDGKKNTIAEIHVSDFEFLSMSGNQGGSANNTTNDSENINLNEERNDLPF